MKKLLTLMFILSIGAGLAFTQSITIIQPNGGELISGSSYEIKWNAAGTTNPFKVTLWRNGALVGNINSTVGAGNGNRQIDWTVGNLEGGGTASAGPGYTIKVKEKTVQVSGTSAGEFKIILSSAPITIELEQIKRPDLKITIECTPGSPAVNEKLRAQFIVENIGEGISKDTTLRVFMGQNNTDTWPVRSLRPGRQYSRSKILRLDGVGHIMWSADVDHGNLIGDGIRENNYVRKKTIIRGPDLKITSASTPDYKKTIQQKCTMHVTVTNIGHADAGRFELDADMDTCKGISHGRDYRVHDEGLKPGESVTFTFTHRYACFKMVGIDLYVDKKKQVVEENEYNNVCGVPFHISAGNIGNKKSPWSTNCP